MSQSGKCSKVTFFRAHTSNHLKSNRKQNGNLFASLMQATSCATAFCLQITINTLTFTLSPKWFIFLKKERKKNHKMPLSNLPRNASEMMQTTKINKNFSRGMSALRNFRYTQQCLSLWPFFTGSVYMSFFNIFFSSNFQSLFLSFVILVSFTFCT